MLWAVVQKLLLDDTEQPRFFETGPLLYSLHLIAGLLEELLEVFLEQAFSFEALVLFSVSS